MIQKSNRFSFSGHDSFQCRLMWLKKGHDYLASGRSFSEDTAGVTLGVGNNMVRSIRFWMRAFGITDELDNLTEFAFLIFGGVDGEEPLDPFLEDEATLWILHFRLVTIGYASTYNLIFNEFRKSKIEFTKNDYVNFVKIKLEEKSLTVSENSITEDFSVFVKMYFGGDAAKDKEDSFSGILSELNMLDFYARQKDDQKKESENVYYIAPAEREDIPEVAILFSILENPSLENSINLNQLEVDEDSPGSVFALTKSGLSNKLRQIVQHNPTITLNEQSGVRELQFRKKLSSTDILKQYYASQAQFQQL